MDNIKSISLTPEPFQDFLSLSARNDAQSGKKSVMTLTLTRDDEQKTPKYIGKIHKNHLTPKQTLKQ